MTTAALVTLEVPSLDDVASLSDDELIERMRRWTEARRIVDVGLARLAAQVGLRSTLELGYGGLAQRSGARTPERLVSQVTGISGAEARTLVTAGSLMTDSPPWLAPVVTRLAEGEISVGVAAAIRDGLGAPTADVAADDLVDAARDLVDEVAELPPEKAGRRAREVRDELDEAGVADREAAMRDKRFLRLTPQSDGMTRIVGLLDPESAALITDSIDLVTAPRRGGPRFVDPVERSRAESIVADPRTTEQLVLDGLVELVRIGGVADANRVFGARKPGVRVHVSLRDFDSGAGVASIEGQQSAVSIATAQRRACADGILPLLFDDRRALDVGRAMRLFTSRQRDALAAVWGGCPVPGCDRPPSWTEAHHVEQWDRDRGNTDVENGILLCRHHHMLVHNNGWEIRRLGDRWFLDPPPSSGARRMELVPKNPITRRRVGRRT